MRRAKDRHPPRHRHGREEEAHERRLGHHVRLDVDDPGMQGLMRSALGVAYIMTRQFDRALEELQKQTIEHKQPAPPASPVPSPLPALPPVRVTVMVAVPAFSICRPLAVTKPLTVVVPLSTVRPVVDMVPPVQVKVSDAW
jgi:hypothetical protein